MYVLSPISTCLKCELIFLFFQIDKNKKLCESFGTTELQACWAWLNSKSSLFSLPLLLSTKIITYFLKQLLRKKAKQTKPKAKIFQASCPSSLLLILQVCVPQLLGE